LTPNILIIIIIIIVALHFISLSQSFTLNTQQKILLNTMDGYLWYKMGSITDVLLYLWRVQVLPYLLLLLSIIW